MISDFMTGEYQVIRSKAGGYIKGRYQPGPKETLIVGGSMQPSSARELKMPEEGNRIKQYWKFYSDVEIVTNGSKTLADADIVVINGETYKAMGITLWQGEVDLPYFMTALWREPQQ